MNTYKDNPMRALEDLTPGGSEFVSDPDRCFQTIQHSQRMVMDLLIAEKKKTNTLRLLLDYVLAVGSILPDDVPEKPSVVFGHPRTDQWSRIFLEARRAKYTLEGKIK